MPSFDEQSVRRISRAVRENERRLRGRKPPRARWHGKGGGGAGVIRFSVTAAGPFLGDLALECDYVVATVLGISCKGAGVSVGDEVNVWDPSQCHFNIPLEVLIGTHGMAAKMVNDTDGVDCIDDRLAEGACRWVVLNLCCVEEIYGS